MALGVVWTGLYARCTAERLLQNTVGGCTHCCRSSVSRFRSHCTSVKVAARALYSASVELRLTVGCLEHFQETKFEPKKMQYLLVDRLSSGSLAQSESAKTVS